MNITIERHPALQMLILAVTVVATLYLGATFIDILAAVNAADVVRLAEAGRRFP